MSEENYEKIVYWSVAKYFELSFGLSNLKFITVFKKAREGEGERARENYEHVPNMKT